MARERNFQECEGREGEAGFVGSFHPYSEWQLVRHKRKPRNPNPRVDDRSAVRRIEWNRVWDSDKRSVTFFFKNFPDNENATSMVERFKVIAPVKDIFIPNRRGRDGVGYGFVRFSNSIDKRRAELMLNEMWFDSI